MDIIEIMLRLGGATLIGGAIGLNRDLHGKPIGVRTLSLVALAAAMAVTLAFSSDPTAQSHSDAASRVIQGVLTGIGFLGMGVITRDAESHKIHGLTTAACTWLTACIGMVCGLAAWPILIVGLILTFAVLLYGGPIEDFFHDRLRHARDDSGGKPDIKS